MGEPSAATRLRAALVDKTWLTGRTADTTRLTFDVLDEHAEMAELLETIVTYWNDERPIDLYQANVPNKARALLSRIRGADNTREDIDG